MNSFSALTTHLLFVVSISATTLVSQTACAESEGVVIDSRSGKPMPGAVVVSAWRGQVLLPAQGGTVCEKAEIAVTDDRGRFSISSKGFNPSLYLRRRNISVFAKGYRTAYLDESGSLKISLQRDVRSDHERLRDLGANPLAGCQVEDRLFLPYYRLVFDEAAPLAKTIEEKQLVDELQYHVESIELGDTEALKRSGVRRAKIRAGGQ